MDLQFGISDCRTLFDSGLFYAYGSNVVGIPQTLFYGGLFPKTVCENFSSFFVLECGLYSAGASVENGGAAWGMGFL